MERYAFLERARVPLSMERYTLSVKRLPFWSAIEARVWSADRHALGCLARTLARNMRFRKACVLNGSKRCVSCVPRPPATKTKPLLER